MTVHATQPQPDSNFRSWLASPSGVRTWTYTRNGLLAAFVFFAAFSLLATFGADVTQTLCGSLLAIALFAVALMLLRFRARKIKAVTDASGISWPDGEEPHTLAIGVAGRGKTVVADATHAPIAEEGLKAPEGFSTPESVDVGPEASPGQPGLADVAPEVAVEAPEGKSAANEPAPEKITE